MTHPSLAEEPRPRRAIGIVGGGQLAWMLAREAHKLGVELHVQTPDATDPATGEAASVVVANLDDGEAIRALARRVERISFENEWVPLDVLGPLERDGIPFLPDLTSLAPLLNKRSQRQLLTELNLPTPHWAGMETSQHPPDPQPAETGEGESSVPTPASSEEDADPPWTPSPLFPPVPQGPRLPEGLTFPVMAKLSRGGYDGKGTRLLADLAALEGHLASHIPEEWILEEQVGFEMELAQVVCRDASGEVRCYPLVQTHQRDQVCEWVLFPAPINHAVEAWARNVSMSLVTSLNYVGVMGIEFFFGPSGLLVNEVAPRVHNSGHLTLEASSTNQFAQHVRIVAGLPLGSTEPTVKGALMINLLGYEPADGADAQLAHRPQRQALEAMGGAHLHWYGKRPRLGRKLGHVTFVLEAEGPQEREEECARRLGEVRAVWPWPQQAGEDAE
ncbi:MAG: 5-(carboxyamino)imidazole ribonucleotide synthase [Cyanobacteriota bacterium]|nr:5-(carboxyamino)imidazole ribonucleotide synthase [Cyanobacteriota bacterium]